MFETTFAKAVNSALAEELRRDNDVFILGEDVAEVNWNFDSHLISAREGYEQNKKDEEVA